MTCGSHVLTRVKVTVSEGAPWAPAAVNREVVAQALPVGPITAGSCAPESWAGTSQGVVPPFSSSQEVPVLRSPRMGQHLSQAGFGHQQPKDPPGMLWRGCG